MDNEVRAMAIIWACGLWSVFGGINLITGNWRMAAGAILLTMAASFLYAARLILKHIIEAR